MSLASAQRNLAKANRKALKVQGESKMGQSLIGSAAEGLQMGMAVGDSMFGITENKKAWKDYEAGQEYMDLDKSEPLTLRQKLFKKPEDIYSDNVRVGNKEYTSKEIQSVGALARSDNKALYEKMMDGNLASSLGTPYSSISPTAPDPGTTGLFNYDDTMSQMNRMSMPQDSKRGLFQARDKKMIDRTFTSLEKPKYNDSHLAAIPEDNPFQIKTKSGNLKAAKFLRENHGMEGTKLSEMIPGWSEMNETERLDKLLEFGYSPGEEK